MKIVTNKKLREYTLPPYSETMRRVARQALESDSEVRRLRKALIAVRTTLIYRSLYVDGQWISDAVGEIGMALAPKRKRREK